MHLDHEDPPGATSSDYFSEAAKVSSKQKTRFTRDFNFKLDVFKKEITAFC